MKNRAMSKWRRIKETHFRTFWDTLAWIAFAYVVIYALLKAIGVLNSPVPIDVAGIVSIAFFVGKYAQKIDFSNKEIDLIKGDLKEVKSGLSAVKIGLRGIGRDLHSHIAEPHH